MNSLPKRRFIIAVSVLLAAALYILIRYAQKIEPDISDDSGALRTALERGPIVDRNGKTLASQVRRYDIYIIPPRERNPNRQNEKIDNLANRLAPVLEMGQEEIRQKIRISKKDFILKRNVTPEAYNIIKAMQEEKGSPLAGVVARAVPFRVYPEKNLAAQIIGFVGAEYQGQEGIEYALNNELAGKENSGRGDRVELTIDANIQYILEKVADSTRKETRAESIVFLAMDPRNGEILGSAVTPGFDPNDFRNSNPEYYRNLPANMPYEPGSVLKAISISALMNSGAIHENSEFICNGTYEWTTPSGKKERIRCADGTAHGRVRPREIIMYSCNIGAFHAASMQNDQNFYQSMLDFGFGKRTGAWRPEMEIAGFLDRPGSKTWSSRTKQSVTFGQEIAVSALQVLQAAGVIANDGLLVPPKIISRIVSADGKTVRTWDNGDNKSRQVISPEVARKMRQYMADTASDMGTGWRGSIGDLSIAIKTGTAQYRDPSSTKGSGYSETDFISSSIALLPAERPSLVLYVVIVKPRGETYGGRIAAPAIREAAEEIVNYLGIPRGRNYLWEHPPSIDIPEERMPAIGARVPSFYGLSKKTILPLLLRNDLHIEMWGDGWVRRQSPSPGTVLTADMVIELYLE
ncbi:MAG: transpeptidase family protein [Treponema sp.]|jgi:cell division protein FtsI (penicillin-binding protein 3)|nr:transpeptidase family protein [Treponema sp.]